MKRNLMLATAATLALLTAPVLAGVDKIEAIDVTADLSAIQNAEAAAYWGTIEADLEAAIAAKVTDRLTDEPGAKVLVDLREVELASAFDRALNLGDAVLVGQVNVTDMTDNSNFNAYELTVSMETARITMGEGETLVLSTDDRATYSALINAFADAVVERLE